MRWKLLIRTAGVRVRGVFAEAGDDEGDVRIYYPYIRGFICIPIVCG